VGPKGATIKRIQQQTNTYIVTPSRDKEPVFEVTGASDNVESARSEILDHISNRTGGLMDANDADSVFHNGDLNSFNDFRNGSIYSGGSQSSFSSFRDSGHARSQSSDSFYYGNSSSKINNDGFNPINSPFSPNGFFFSDFPSPTDKDASSDGNSSGSGGFDPTPTPPSPSIWAPVSNVAANSFSRSSSLNGSNLQNSIVRPASPQNVARRLKSESLAGTFSALQAFTPFSTQISSSASTEALSLANVCTAGVIGTTTTVVNVIGTKTSVNGETNNNQPASKDKKKECVICCESEVVAALVPCGHNLFCMECADKIREENSACPVCQKQVIQVLRIFS
jgi:RNA-binding protein MEX3